MLDLFYILFYHKDLEHYLSSIRPLVTVIFYSTKFRTLVLRIECGEITIRTKLLSNEEENLNNKRDENGHLLVFKVQIFFEKAFAIWCSRKTPVAYNCLCCLSKKLKLKLFELVVIFISLWEKVIIVFLICF